MAASGDVVCRCWEKAQAQSMCVCVHVCWLLRDKMIKHPANVRQLLAYVAAHTHTRLALAANKLKGKWLERWRAHRDAAFPYSVVWATRECTFSSHRRSTLFHSWSRRIEPICPITGCGNCVSRQFSPLRRHRLIALDQLAFALSPLLDQVGSLVFTQLDRGG